MLPLSECASKYAAAVSDPWSPEAAGACVPTFPSRPSQKVTAFARFTVTVGTNGFGFVLFAPTTANDSTGYYYSTASYAGTTATCLAGSGVTFGSYTNLPYNKADQVPTTSSVGSNTIGGRIVSFGASAQYTGTELNRGGLIYTLSEPGHFDMEGFTLANFGSYRECDIDRVSNSKKWLTVYGQSASEVQYPDDWLTINTTVNELAAVFPFSRHNHQTHNTFAGAPIAGFAFTGTAGNTFEVECVMHLEYVGYKCQPVLTPSHSDARGFEIVQQALGALQLFRTANSKGSLRSILFAEIRRIAADMAIGTVGGVGAVVLKGAATYALNRKKAPSKRGGGKQLVVSRKSKRR